MAICEESAVMQIVCNCPRIKKKLHFFSSTPLEKCGNSPIIVGWKRRGGGRVIVINSSEHAAKFERTDPSAEGGKIWLLDEIITHDRVETSQR